jgi:RsiW-degrading membrane proteinase PrsW (M82 family)
VGLIEEGCKIVAVMLLARRLQHDREIDGLLLGGAVGMGFAALESTGYAFTAFLESRGAVGASIAATVIRGALAPFGHGVWTAILGAVLFRQSAPRHFRLAGSVILTYLLVALLHGLWDGLPRIQFLVLPLGIRVSIASVVINLLGIGILIGLWRQAIRRAPPQPAAAAPAEAPPAPGTWPADSTMRH